jgi:tRNA pseudouridine38-40 synthase
VRLVDGGVPCLRIRIEGSSFMLNQIRNMVGSAAACAAGAMPEALLAASLSPRVRAATVKAPPHTLVLAGASFSPFATAYGTTPSSASASASATGDEDAGAAAATAAATAAAGAAGGAEGGVARWSGDRLRLRARGLARQAHWRREELGPAVQALLLHDDWRAWAEEELPRLSWPDAEQVAMRDAAWRDGERRRKERHEEERAARRAAAVAAAAAAAAAAGVAAEAGGGGPRRTGLLGWLRGLVPSFTTGRA